MILLLISLTIIYKPIKFGPLRKELTRKYMAFCYQKNGIKINPKMIIVHYTKSSSFESSFRELYPEIRHPYRAEKLDEVSKLNVSAHYLIDRNGKIYHLLPDTIMARHCGGLNWCALGIEIVALDSTKITREQRESLLNLIIHLKRKYPEIEYLIGHCEYLKMKSCSLFLWNPKISPPTPREDPGFRFMRRLREQLRKKGIHFKTWKETEK